MNRKKCSYLAGLIDGEGTIGFSKCNGKYRVPVISIASTTFEFMDFLQNNFGGVVISKKVYSDKHSPSWEWRVTNQRALGIMLDVKEYMIEPKKVSRIEFLLNNYNPVRNGRYTDEEIKQKLQTEIDFFKI